MTTQVSDGRRSTAETVTAVVLGVLQIPLALLACATAVVVALTLHPCATTTCHSTQQKEIGAAGVVLASAVIAAAVTIGGIAYGVRRHSAIAIWPMLGLTVLLVGFAAGYGLTRETGA
ncbi:hypothetical protein [Luteipulveratus halotolerans]|nr:hypothetical protein [Luteipulveratus halotolerans]